METNHLSMTDFNNLNVIDIKDIDDMNTTFYPPETQEIINEEFKKTMQTANQFAQTAGKRKKSSHTKKK